MDEKLTESEQAAFDEMRNADAEVPTEETAELQTDSPQPDNPEITQEQEKDDIAENNSESQPQPQEHKVPVHVLKREREEKRALKDELTQLKHLVAQMQTQMVQGEVVNPPSIEEDPIGYMQSELERTREEAKRANEFVQQIQQQQQIKQAYNTKVNEIQDQFMAARQEIPDLDKGINFLCEQIAGELRIKKPDITQPEIDQYLALQAISLNNEAAEYGMSIGEYLYRMAKVRGFSGETRAGVVNQQAVNSARTLAANGGQAAGAEVDLMDLPADEFLKEMKKLYS